MLSVRSCSPDEMKILVPVIAHDPSAFGSARVRIRPRSVPHCGSVRFIVPPHSPDTILGTYFAFCSSDPLTSSAAIAPWLSPGYIANAILEEIIYSWNAVETTCGMPCPPNSSGADSVPQPDSTNAA